MTPYEKLLKLHGKIIADRAVSYTKITVWRLEWDNDRAKLARVLVNAFPWGGTSEGIPFWRSIRFQTQERD